MQFDRIEDVKQAIDVAVAEKNEVVATLQFDGFVHAADCKCVAPGLPETASRMGRRSGTPEGNQQHLRLLRRTHHLQVRLACVSETCSKIRYDFNELSTEQAQQLFSMLFAVAQQYKENRTTLRNEICLDIATLLLRWSDLTNIVGLAVENIGATGNEYMLLNVLSMLPVEVNSKRVSLCHLPDPQMPIFDEQREAKIHDMEGSASQVLQYMDSLLVPFSNDEQMVVASSPSLHPGEDLQLLPSLGLARLLQGGRARRHVAPALPLPSLASPPLP